MRDDKSTYFHDIILDENLKLLIIPSQSRIRGKI